MTYEDLVKMLHGVHTAISPSVPSALGSTSLRSLMGSGMFGGMMRAGMGAAQPDILSDPATMARMQGYLKAQEPQVASAPPPPFGGPASLFSPPSASAAPLVPPQAPEEPVGAPALSPQALPPAASAPAPVTMPTPRPPEAPQAPAPMGFFARNTAMMQDPANPGSFIDPEAASRAQASGPDVINKLLSMFHQKDT